MADAIAHLMRIHYGPVFMGNSRFWYGRDLQEADKLIVVAASNMRLALQTFVGKDGNGAA